MPELTKETVLTYCHELLDDKVETLLSEIAKVEESASNETKSSMGDKYETGREMMMQEKGKLNDRLQLLLDQKMALSTIKKQLHETIRQGSLVHTTLGVYFIVAAIGSIKIKDGQVFVISQSAPLAKEMMGKKVGDEIAFNGRSQKILDIS